jgi:hypothetical protein
MKTVRCMLHVVGATLSLLGAACGGEELELETATTTESAMMVESLDDEAGKSCSRGKTTYEDGSGRACKQGSNNEWMACCCRDGEWKTEKLDGGCSLPN